MCLRRYDATCLLLVYGVYIVVLCFDLRISEFVLRKLSPCCTCLGQGSAQKKETQPLMGWNDDSALRVHSRSRTDSGIFQDDSGYSHLSLSLHGLNEIPEGTMEEGWVWRCSVVYSREEVTEKQSECPPFTLLRYHRC